MAVILFKKKKILSGKMGKKKENEKYGCILFLIKICRRVSAVAHWTDDSHTYNIPEKNIFSIRLGVLKL